VANLYGNFPAGGPPDLLDEALANAIDEYGARWNDEFKRRGMPTVPTKKDLTKVARQDADLEILQRMADPFRLTVMHIKVDAVTEISISHPENGFARRRINDAELASVHSPLQMWKGKIKEMRAELGFGTSDYDLPKTEDAVPIVPAAQSQHHTCGKHGNQLVAARNEETGETALRCPVTSCTTILRKRRKPVLIPSEEAKAAWNAGAPLYHK
jgi:hypothetical protein